MAYTIVKSDGVVLTSIPDGTINTSSTSLGLPGRNYAGYGQALDTNFVHLMENFADTTVPPNPIRGQLWCDTSGGTVAIKVCPADGTTNALAWLTLAATSSGGTTSFGAVTVTGNITSNNMVVTNEFSANTGSLSFLTVSANANIANANITSATIGTLTSTAITAGSLSTAGTLTGVWTANGSGTANGVNGTSMWITGGNLVTGGVISATGNATAANLITAGQVTATGNITSSAYLKLANSGNSANGGQITYNTSLNSIDFTFS
jgi:hypothetical protein